MRKQVFSLLVNNNVGLLSRVAGLFSRRGYSIDSITAGPTSDERFTRLTVVASGDEQILSQIEKQLAKLEDVVDITTLAGDESVCRELVLVKVKASPAQKTEIILLAANSFRANIIDVGKDSLIFELTGNQSKVEAFISLMEEYEILEIARTGITALARGTQDTCRTDANES